MSAPRWLRAYLWGLACRACGHRPGVGCRCGTYARWAARGTHWRSVVAVGWAARVGVWRGRGVG